MIKLSNLTKRYEQGAKTISVLDNLSFDIKLGGTTAIVGKSGCGKSTLLSLMGGLDHPTSGDVTIGNTCISKMSEEELSKYRSTQIGIVFQNFHLINSLTALENVLLPLEVNKIKNAKEKALSILDMVGLSDRVHHFPGELSGGECQRVAIARAVVIDPEIVLADEPSGNLDPETGEALMSILFETAKKLEQTLIVVTHDYDLAKKCDRTLELKNNELKNYDFN